MSDRSPQPAAASAAAGPGPHAPDVRPRAGALLRDTGFWADWAVLPALALLVVVFGALDSTFLSADNLESILAAAAVLIVLATGQFFAVALGGIDLSMGSVITLCGVVFGQLFADGSPTWLCIAAAILAGAAFGLVQGSVIARARIADFIVTLGGLSIATGLALVLSGGRPVEVIDSFMLDLSTSSIGPLRLTVVVALVVVVLAHVAVFHTRFGTHLLATGGNEEGARALGIATARVKTAAYGIAGLLAGVAAVLLVARVGSAEPAAGTSLLLQAIAAVVLGGVSLFGGRGSVLGPLAGALLLTALVNGLTLLGVNEAYQPVATGVVVVLSAALMRFQR